MTTTSRAITIACLSACFLSSAVAMADDLSGVQTLIVQRQAAAGDCDRVLSNIEESAGADWDAGTRLIAGQCAIASGRYAEARDQLERARAQDPNRVGVQLYLGIAQYHLEEFDAARRSLSEARVEGRERALVDFYEGLLLLRDSELRASALAFERASATDPGLVDPVSSYYAALAWQSLKEADAFDAAIDRVLAAETDGPWASEARRLRAMEELRRDPEPRYWASVTGGLEYDSNASLRATGLPLPPNVSDESDIRGIWNVEGGAKLYESGNWSGGIAASYTGTAYQDVKRFDQQYPTVSGWTDYDFSKQTTGRLRADFGYGWIGNDPFVLATGLTTEAIHDWGSPGKTRCTLGGYYYDFKYDIVADFPIPSLIDVAYLNRDGAGVRVGCEHDLPILGGLVLLTGGYFFDNYWSEGQEFDHFANQFNVGARVRLPWKFGLEFDGSYIRRDFANQSYYALPPLTGPDREDNALGAVVELDREILRWLKASIRYEYMNSGSNIEAYDYKRHIVGGYLTFGWQGR